MSFPVVSSLSAEELAGLGEMHEKFSTHPTGTVLTGSDMLSEDNSMLGPLLEKLCARRPGTNIWPYKTAVVSASSAT